MAEKGSGEGVWVKLTPERERALLIRAIESDDVADLRELLQAGASVGEPAERSGSSLLSRAIVRASGVFGLLLEFGADPMAESRSSLIATMLNNPCERGEAATLARNRRHAEELIQAGARHDSPMGPCGTVWQQYLDNGAPIELLEPWVRQGADLNRALRPGWKSEENGLLARSLIYGTLEEVEMLLGWGADPLDESGGPSALQAARDMVGLAQKNGRSHDGELERALLVIAASERALLLSGVGAPAASPKRAAL